MHVIQARRRTSYPVTRDIAQAREAVRMLIDGPSEHSILLREILSRTWFLERVLKLNLVPIAKEYTCVRNVLGEI